MNNKPKTIQELDAQRASKKKTEIKEKQYQNSLMYDRVIPNRIEIIRKWAFVHCKNLKEIVFQPDSQIRIIESSAFRGCPKLKKIVFPPKIINVYGTDIDFSNIPSDKLVALIALMTKPIRLPGPRRGGSGSKRGSNPTTPNEAKGRHYSWWNSKK